MLKSKLTILSLLLLGAGASYADRLVDVTVDTHTVAPGTTGYLDFQFNLGSLVTQPATVQILNFTGATYVAGTQQLTGGASGGPLPSTITLVNSSGFDDAFEGVSLGNSLNFVLDFGGSAVNSPNGTATSPSEFLFSMYSDANGTVPLLTTDPGGILGTVTVNLNGSLTTQSVSSNLTFSAVPEPSAFLLLGGGLGLLGALRRLRRR